MPACGQGRPHQPRRRRGRRRCLRAVGARGALALLAAALLPRAASAGSGADGGALPGLPDAAEQERALQCGQKSPAWYLDFTQTTPKSSQLPLCVQQCSEGTEAVGTSLPGDVPSCVWPSSNPQARLRFDLYQWCRESQCEYKNRWDFYTQMVSVKVAHLLGVPLSEVQSAFLYWVVPDWPPPANSPRLQRFLVSRRREVDFPGNSTGRRLATAVDPWYVLHLTVRIDTRRILKRYPTVQIIMQNDTNSTRQYLGINAEVRNFEFATLPEEALYPREHGDFAPVYQFQDFGPNTIPGEGWEMGGVARPSEQGCLDICYAWNEATNNSRCLNDCECNGNRWCGLLGLCTGVALDCRSGGSVLPTRTTTLPPNRQSTSPPVVATTTTGIRGRLSSGCGSSVQALWQPCELGTEVAACDGISCAVVSVAIDSSNVVCRADVCAAMTAADAPLRYWLGRCGDQKMWAAFNASLVTYCGASTTKAPDRGDPSTPSGGHSDGVSVSVVAALGACVGACCLLVCVVKLFSCRARIRECAATCAGRLCPRREQPDPYDNPAGRRRHSSVKGTVRASQTATVKPLEQTGRTLWNFLPPKLQEKLKPPATPSKKGGKEKQRSRRSDRGEQGDRSPRTRQAWSEGAEARGPEAPPGKPFEPPAKDAWGPEPPGGTAGPGPRAAAAAGGGAPTGDPEAQALLLQLRKLRAPEHSAGDRKKFFREQLLKWHPDKNIGQEEHAAEMFKVLQDSKGWFLNED